MVRPYLDRIGGKVENDVSLFTGGLNTYVDKAFLDANQMPFVINMTMTQPPKMETRPTRLSLADYFPDKQYPFGEKTILNMFMDGELGFFVIAGDGENAWVEEYEEKDTGWEVTNLGALDVQTSRYFFCHCWTAQDHYIYIMNENGKWRLEKGDNGWELSSPYTDDFYGIPEFHKGRLFIANPTTRTVVASYLYDFDNFDLQQTTYQLVATLPDPENASNEAIYLMEYDTDYYTQYRYLGDGTNVLWKVLPEKILKTDVTIDGNTGTSLPDYSVCAAEFNVANAIGDIVGMKSFDDKLYIFCKNSMHLLYGTTPDTSLSNQFQLVDLNNGIGAYNQRCICVGSDYLFWLGNDKQVYQHTGSYTYMISRPTEEGTGGIDNLFNKNFSGPYMQMCATNAKMFLNIGVRGIENDTLLVYDIYNKIWWAEDGELTSIAENKSQPGDAMLFMARPNGDIVYQYAQGTDFDTDMLYNFEENKLEEAPIKYEFQTRVYGADGTDTRKTISDMWFQARATASVYLGDLWTATNLWKTTISDNSHLHG